eukprot:1067301-Rhodomonas_salina.1
MTSEFRAIVSDVSLTHPYIGDADDRSTWGNYKADYVTRRIDDKNSKHQRFHHDQNFLFLALVCNTFGIICDDALRLLFFISHQAATNYFDTIGDRIFDNDGKFRAAFLHHRSSLFNRFKSRITLAACRGMARRGDLSSVHNGIGTELQDYDDGTPGTTRRPTVRLRRRRPGRRGGEQHCDEPLWVDNDQTRGASAVVVELLHRGARAVGPVFSHLTRYRIIRVDRAQKN